ncbi:MAG: Nif3-like dinuclear metal center hexameric protein [Syntrophobacteraceae bacterium]
MVRVKDIIQWVDCWAPFRYAESWDNCGLQVGSPHSIVDRALIALDPGAVVLKEARELGCQCLLTHHPLLLRPIRNVHTDSWPGSIIAYALSAGINIIAAHTNLDAAVGGTNAQLKALLGLESVMPLDIASGFAGDEQYLGIGLAGSLPRAVRLESLAERLDKALGAVGVRMAGDPQRLVGRVAICTGSGASLLGKVLESGADVFVTGDMKYHDWRMAEETGLAVIDIGHYASERIVLQPFAAFLEKKAKSEKVALEVFISGSEKDPFRVITGKC